MKDPVICIGDGNTYERAEIENYFKQNGLKSPVTGAAVESPMTFPNNALKGLIAKFMNQNMHNLQQDSIANDSEQEGVADTGYI